MQNTFTIEEPKLTLSWRLMFLIAAGLLLALGLAGVVSAIPIVLGTAPWPPHFAAISLVTCVALVLGCLMTIPFFLPAKEFTFDARGKEVRFAFKYACGIRRSGAFPIARATTQVIWRKNSEYTDGGFWALLVTLPDRRKITRAPSDPNTTAQKAQVQAWQTLIKAMQDTT